MPAKTPKKENSDHLKDSCNYSIGITKTLLSFSAAGIAFVITILLSSNNFYPKWSVWLIVILLAISILLGLLFLMNVVGHINSFQNYNVNLPRMRKITIGQMVSFFVAISVLGGFAICHGTNESISNEKSFIHINAENGEFKKYISEKDSISIEIINGELKLKFKH